MAVNEIGIIAHEKQSRLCLIFRSPEGKPGYHQAESLEDAVRFVELVRNHEQVTDARVFRMDEVPAQDYMAWETQGYVADRSAERLATSDRGVVMLREMLRREIERVQQGLDPLGVIRDPDHEMIDTGLLRSVREYFGRDRSQSRGQRQPVEA